MKNEVVYQATMSVVRKMLSEKIINADEYRQIDTIFREKYRPIFGTLFSDISLTNHQFRVNIDSERSGLDENQ